jgi:hypothetical protein
MHPAPEYLSGEAVQAEEVSVACLGMSEPEFADDFLPVYDVSDAVAVVVDADREVTWQALLDVDLLKLGRSAPLVGILGALRMLPEVVGHLLHGERPAKPPESMRLRDLPSIPMHEGGFIMIVVLGLFVM